MLKIIWLFLLLSSSLFSLEIDGKTTFTELLSHAEIYKDFTRTESISNIQNKQFEANNKTLLGEGYAPKYDVWIKFTLTNTDSHSIEKIIEYENPLTSYVDFFEEGKLKKRDGLFSSSKEKISLTPILKITLQANQSKTFYIRASSTVTTLIIKLNLWDIESFNKKNMRNQVILALFFGAMGIVILYNLIIYLATKELSYLFYTLFFITINFHHLIYKGITSLYIFSTQSMITIIDYSSFTVALPTIFLALFTQYVLKLEQYPRLNKAFTYLLILFLIFVVTIHITEAYQYRKFFFIILIISFSIVCYMVIKKNKRAYPLLFAWILFITSGIFMYLSSSGKYDIFTLYPYYTESSLILETILFTLASKITIQNQVKIDIEKHKFLLQELNHRVNNNMQRVISVITLQRNEITDIQTQDILFNIENQIRAVTKLYSLLYIKDNMAVVNTHEYFSSITQNIQKSFKKEEININIQSNIIMDSEHVIYCGLIINETVTNAFKYAFNNITDAKIDILFFEEENNYHLKIKDNGNGFKENFKNGLGLNIIDTLATLQFNGTLKLEKNNGVQIDIVWRKNEEKY